MSNHDEWATPDEGSALSAELRRLAEDAALFADPVSLTRRVHRRRTAKLVGAGAGALAFAAALAVTASSLAMPDTSEPLPAETSTTRPAPRLSQAPKASPSPSPSASLSPSASPTGLPPALYTDGWQPQRWKIAGGAIGNVRCGMPVAELEGLSRSTALRLSRAGGLEPDDADGGWLLPVELVLGPGVDVPHVVERPTLVWSQGGVVVDLGDPSAHLTDLAPALAEDSRWTGGATASSASQCLPDTRVEQVDSMFDWYDNERAGGTYEVRAVTLYDFDGDGEMGIALSDPVTVTLENGAGAPIPERVTDRVDPETPAYGQGWEVPKQALPLLGIECLDHESSFLRTDAEYSLQLTGTVSGPSYDWRAPARLVSASGQPVPEWGQPVLLLLRTDGRLAGIGYDPTASWPRVPTGTDTAEATAMSGVTTACRQHSGGEFEPNAVPAGEYIVRAMTEINPPDASTDRKLIFSDAVPVVVDAQGNITRR